MSLELPIGIEHLLLGLIREGEGLAIKVLKSLEIDIILLRKKVEDAIKDNINMLPANADSLPLTKQAEKVMRITVLEAKNLKSSTVSTEHLMLAILKNKDNVGTQLLNKMEVDYDIYAEGEAELGWPEARLALLRGDQEVYAGPFEAAGWRAFRVAEVLADPAAFLSVLAR